MAEKREYYRIKYRPGDRPVLVIAGVKFDVLDLSEQGMRFASGGRYRPQDGTQVSGKVSFKSGKSCLVEGTMIRYDHTRHACIVQLSLAVPLTLIMEEQRIILKKYQALE